MNIIPRPPAEIAYLVELLGAEAALKLIETFGGTTIYIAKTVREDGRLCAAVGFPAARLLADNMGGERIKLPLLKFWLVHVYASQGRSYSQIARALRMSEGSVWQHLHNRGQTIRSRGTKDI